MVVFLFFYHSGFNYWEGEIHICDGGVGGGGVTVKVHNS